MKKILMNKKIKVLLIVILSFVVIWSAFAIIPPKKINNNPFIIKNGESPLIAAHRGGRNLNPENTFKAFDYSIENFDTDILELDLWITKEDENGLRSLILSHDETINRCSDVEEYTSSSDAYYISEHTLEELSKFNFGYKFKTKDGIFPYKNILKNVEDEDRTEKLRENGIAITTIEELFKRYYQTDLLFIVEIKNGGDLGYIAADLLLKTMKEYNLERRVVIGTFNGEVEDYLEEKYPETIRGGSVAGVTKFVVTQIVGVNIFDSSSFACLQIPTSRQAAGLTIKLDKKTFINRAHRRGISVQFWTINEKEEMRHLIELGADVIMTDNPDVLYELLKEMGYR